MAPVITSPDFRTTAQPVEGKFVHLSWRDRDYLLFAAAVFHHQHA